MLVESITIHIQRIPLLLVMAKAKRGIYVVVIMIVVLFLA
jgi:hypothetical protein